MRQPIHQINASGSRWTSERIAGVGFVGLLHVIAIYALVTGLAQKIVKAIPRDLQVTVSPAPEKQEPVVAPKLPDVPAPPLDSAIVPPEIDIAPDQTAPISVPLSQPSVSDAQAAGVSSTHTTPPYPPVARKLGEQGTVRLRLTISPQGAVTAADVVQSSGFDDLDRSAVDWVIAHWKYKPATRGGVAVASQTEAVVIFNLKTAR
ncbi:MAG TPA: energy transducer TonB [Rhizomicrobium sp.]|nr:energy transducer TonB [Rhizomicrobium sp.]